VDLTDNPIVAAETSASTSSSSSGSLDVSLNDAEIAAEEDVVISMTNPNKIHRVYEMRGTMFHELQGAPSFSRVHNGVVCDALFI
jgi:hypothetical protein